MRTINILYWISTILLCALMLFSAINSLLNPGAANKFMVDHLHYPTYLIQFLSVAKILGVAAILVPGFPRLKEWAYAGFTFDLLGAFYSFIVIGDPVSSWILFPVFLALIACSYICYHRRRRSVSGVLFGNS